MAVFSVPGKLEGLGQVQGGLVQRQAMDRGPEIQHVPLDRTLSVVPVVNQDGGPVASTFIKLLGEHADVRPMSRAEAEHLVRDKHEAAAAIVFPPQLSKQYLQGRSSEILLLTDPAAGSDLQGIKVLLLLMDKEAAALADPFAEDKITLKEQNLTGNRLSVTVFEQRVPGLRSCSCSSRSSSALR